MKTNIVQKSLAIMVVACMATFGLRAGAQQTTATPTAPPAVSIAPPALPYGVPQILQLSQAKIGDDTVIAYVKNSGNSYNLNADQIVYLKQQGLSEPVITAMLNQPKAGVAAMSDPAATPPPSATVATSGASTATYDDSLASVPTATVAPTVTYVQSAPADDSSYYAQPYYYPYAYYPYYGYGWYPGVSIGFGYGYHGWYGGGWHGGYGYHGGGGFHGGGGGFHGGGGGFHGGGGGFHGGGGGHR
jgi:hypothetical protein